MSPSPPVWALDAQQARAPAPAPRKRAPGLTSATRGPGTTTDLRRHRTQARSMAGGPVGVSLSAEGCHLGIVPSSVGDAT